MAAEPEGSPYAEDEGAYAIKQFYAAADPVLKLMQEKAELEKLAGRTPEQELRLRAIPDELVRREAAFQEVVRDLVSPNLQKLYQTKLVRIFAGHSLNITPEEGAQETWQRLYGTWEHPGSRYRPEVGRFWPWLQKIARNVKFDHALVSPPSDAELMRRMQAGEDTRPQIKQRYYRSLEQFFLRELNRGRGRSPKSAVRDLRQQAEDLAARTLDAAFRRAHEFDPDAKQFVVWLMELAKQVLPGAKGSPSEYVPASKYVPSKELSLDDFPASKPWDPVRELHERDLQVKMLKWSRVCSKTEAQQAVQEFLATLSNDKVRQAFQKLSPLEQCAFLLTAVLEMSVSEVARILGTSNQAVYNAVSKARKKLERSLS